MFPLLALLLNRAKRHHVAVLLSLAVSAIVVGGLLFAITQSVSIGTGLYWAVVTASTVGYGDVTPHDTAGRIIAVCVILTTIPLLASVFALISALAAAVQFRRLFTMERALPEGRFSIVYGWHPAVPSILEELMGCGRKVVLVADVDESEVPTDVHLVPGDPTSEHVIRKSHPERAMNAVVVGADDGDVLVTCVALRALAPNLSVFALANSARIAQALRELGLHQTLSSDQLVAHTLAKSMEAPHAGELLLQLIDSEKYQMQETAVTPEMLGQRVTVYHADQPTLVLGLIRNGDVTLILDDDPVMQEGDIIVSLQTRTPTSAR